MKLSMMMVLSADEIKSIPSPYTIRAQFRDGEKQLSAALANALAACAVVPGDYGADGAGRDCRTSRPGWSGR